MLGAFFPDLASVPIVGETAANLLSRSLSSDNSTRSGQPSGIPQSPFSTLIISLHRLLKRVNSVTTQPLNELADVWLWHNEKASILACLAWISICLFPYYVFIIGPYLGIISFMLWAGLRKELGHPVVFVYEGTSIFSL